MTPMEVLRQAQDALTVKRVFGEPYERGGLTVIPVAAVYGGGGGGSGPTESGQEGGGAGFGIVAHPVGVYVIRDGEVLWQPSLDINRVALMGQVVAITALLVLRRVLLSRARGRR